MFGGFDGKGEGRLSKNAPSCHPEPKAKDLREAVNREDRFAEILRCAQDDRVECIAGQPQGEAFGGRFVLAFDTANEVVALGVGELVAETRLVKVVATREIRAHRASNTTLVPAVDRLLGELGVAREDIACVCVGRGPGSFTGVRIAMATAKGMASALGVGLVGVSTLDAIAWNAQASGVRGDVLVIADAMRKEVYPVRFALSDDGVNRLSADRVVKADAFADELGASGFRARRRPSFAGTSGMRMSDEAKGSRPRPTPFLRPGLMRGKRALTGKKPALRHARWTLFGKDGALSRSRTLVIGDGLVKYRALYEPCGTILDEGLWEVSGRGLLMALAHAWRTGEADPLDAARHDPAFALPVYTRLSDAEENERIRLAADSPKNLTAGVQDPVAIPAPDGGLGRATMHAQARPVARADEHGVTYRPLDARHADAVAALEGLVMASDAWNAAMVAEELGHRNRTWWVAEADGELAGYAGGMVVDGDLQVLKVATEPSMRRRGVARELLVRIAEDARNLGARSCSLEVRAGNAGAQAFYEAMGLSAVGVRPRYYSDREDAVIMQGPLPAATRDVAGMELKHLGEGEVDAAPPPIILAIESSCDETAAAVVDASGTLRSDVVASQVDFHARFGGVVPEIASRKHIEAICGVCAEALDVAGGLSWRDLDAIAVTYAPGLLGALVVGVAFAKGAAWALDVPFIGVNHLEGHLYANKIGDAGFEPPAVVSLVSGGNTMLVHMRDWGDYVTLGATIDDAVGEAFDKVSKALGLGYPGGPAISAQAALGDPAAIDFPRAMLHSHDLRFSLSGLKTAVVNHINKERQAGRDPNIPDIAASFQQAVVDVQVAKAKAALQQTGATTFCLGGGVAANPALRAAYEKLCARMNVRLVMPPLASCGDNAGMIALVALDRYNQRKFFPLDADAAAHADLDEPY